MTTTPTSGAADPSEALRSIQRFEVVDCIDDKHVPAVIPKPHGPWVRYEDHIAALAAGQATAAQQPDSENLRKALQFYADSEHFIKSDGDAWDTVSDEPQNYWCDEAGTATVEDGHIARLALSGHPVRFEDDAAQPAAQQGAAYAALPEYGINTASHAHFRVLGFTADQMRAFADATHTLRASHGQAPAAPKGGIDE